MSTFKEIRGQLIKSLSSDPSPATAGDMWYNSSTNLLKGSVLSGAWSTGGTTVTSARQRFATGTQTAGLLFGGFTPPNTTATEEYNGSSWTAGGALSTARRSPGGAGTQTASLCIGGFSTAASTTVEEYNGTAWTGSPALNNVKFLAGSFGTSSAAVTEGGAPAPKAFETWDDSSWTAGPGPIGPANSYGSTGAGTATAGLFAGGYPSSPTDNLTRALEYNGSSFSSSGSMNSGRGYMQGFGVQTSAVMAGGSTGPGPASTATETYDGANFTTSPATLGTATTYGGGTGTSSAGFVAGGGPDFPSRTEEYNLAAATKTFTTS